MTEHVSDIDRLAPERDPGPRRRLDAEQLRQRDAAVDRMLRAGVTYRAIAKRLHMSYGSVQQTVARLRGQVPARARKVRPPPQHKSRFDRPSGDDW